MRLTWLALPREEIGALRSLGERALLAWTEERTRRERKKNSPLGALTIFELESDAELQAALDAALPGGWSEDEPLAWVLHGSVPFFEGVSHDVREAPFAYLPPRRLQRAARAFQQLTVPAASELAAATRFLRQCADADLGRLSHRPA